MACWVIAVRGTYLPAVKKDVEAIVEGLKRYKCFYIKVLFHRYIIVCDKEDKCYKSEELVKQFEARPSTPVLTPEEFLEEIVKE